MILTDDQVNSLFQLGAMISVLNHCRLMWRSKEANGVSILSTLFFASWGLWNLWFYTSLKQPWSFYASVGAMFANSFWVFSIWYIRRTYR
jgi:hypothetical protein